MLTENFSKDFRQQDFSAESFRTFAIFYIIRVVLHWKAILYERVQPGAPNETLFVNLHLAFLDLCFRRNFSRPAKHGQRCDLCRFVSQDFSNLPENLLVRLHSKAYSICQLKVFRERTVRLSDTFWPKKFSANISFRWRNIDNKCITSKLVFFKLCKNFLFLIYFLVALKDDGVAGF